MLNIERFVCNMFQENCYIVSDETGECVIIDCGAFYQEEKDAIVSYIKDNNLKPVHLLCTHGHIDHNFGNNALSAELNMQPEMHNADTPLYERLKEQASILCGVDLKEDIVPMGRYFSDGEIISFGSHKFKVINTPGHTPGSVFFYCEAENLAFSGDTLFRFSIGRTDFELGSYEDIIASLKNITSILPSSTTILPGHGPKTTIGEELRYNPYLK